MLVIFQCTMTLNLNCCNCARICCGTRIQIVQKNFYSMLRYVIIFIIFIIAMLPKVAMVLLLKQKSISTCSCLQRSRALVQIYRSVPRHNAPMRRKLQNAASKPPLIFYPLYSHNVSSVCEMKSLLFEENRSILLLLYEI